MATPHATRGQEPSFSPSTLTRATQVALVLNALAHGAASLGMALGLGPHAAEQPNMGRRAAAAGFAAVVMFLFVAMRLRRDASLIVLPMAFVFFNLADSAYGLLAKREASSLPPAVAETIFLLVYAAFVVMHRSARNAAGTVR